MTFARAVRAQVHSTLVQRQGHNIKANAVYCCAQGRDTRLLPAAAARGGKHTYKPFKQSSSVVSSSLRLLLDSQSPPFLRHQSQQPNPDAQEQEDAEGPGCLGLGASPNLQAGEQSPLKS